MKTVTAALKVNHETANAEIFFNGEKIGECKVFTKFNHCFENDYFSNAYKVIEKSFKDLTGISISEAGTKQLFKVDYRFI